MGKDVEKDVTRVEKKRIYMVRDEPWNSFGRQASLLEEELKRRGHEVKPQDKRSFLRVLTPPGFNTYLYYTVFNSSFFETGILPHDENVIFEVADSDRLSQKAVNFFLKNHVNKIVTPSQFSKEAFLNSTKEKLPPIHVIRHMLNPKMFEYPEMNVAHPCVLCVCPHSWDRKGCDLATEAVRKALDANVYFLPVITSPKPVENMIWRKVPVPDHQYYSLMKSCDILLYPVRGGAFEIPVFEALALGLDVVVTEKGPWMEYVQSPDDVYRVKVDGMKRYWYTNLYHVGKFFDPDRESVLENLLTAVRNWTPERKKERLDTVAPRYREYLSVEKVVDEWEKVL